MKSLLLILSLLVFGKLTRSFKTPTHENVIEKAYFMVASMTLDLESHVEYKDAFSLFEAAFGSVGGSLNGSSSSTDIPTTRFFQQNLLETLSTIPDIENKGPDSYFWTADSLLKSYELIKTLQNSMRKISSGNFKELRKLCTQYLMVAQNFYARTNYIESGNTEPAPFLIFPTSPLPSYIKDLGKEKEDQYNSYHKQATFLALNTTMEVYYWIYDKIMKKDKTQFKNFLGINGGKTIAFNIDDTGSMSDEIAAAKSHALSIVNSYSSSKNPPTRYLIQTFNDPDIGEIVTTSQLSVIESTFEGINADGGGDAPEMCLTGLLNILDNLASKDYSEIFVYTDAEAKDTYKLSTVLSMVESKGARVTFLLTGSLSPRTTSAYTTISDKSNGDVIHTSKSTILNTVEFLIERADALSEPVLNLKNIKTSKIIDINVDSSVKNIKFNLNNLDSISSISMRKPDGVLVSPTLVSSMTDMSMYEIKNPMFGKWYLNITLKSEEGVKPYNLKMNFQSDSSINVRIVEEIWDVTEVEAIEFKVGLN